MSIQSVAPDAFKAGMRRLTGAVTLITTSVGGLRHGLTASAVCSLSVDPPSLIVCVNKTASAHAHILEAGYFAVNVLGQTHTPQAKVFSDTKALAERFSAGHWKEGVSGAPLLDDALVSFDCAIDEIIAKRTHTIIIGNVLAVSLGPDPVPLVYYDGIFGTFGQG